jgi:hypothetical protein
MLFKYMVYGIYRKLGRAFTQYPPFIIRWLIEMAANFGAALSGNRIHGLYVSIYIQSSIYITYHIDG